MPDPVPDRAANAFRARFSAEYPFGFDRFQFQAFDAFDRGDHIVVAAPTGSGKTVVAEYAIRSMLEHGQRSFYTTPIKALSNQKYRDLAELYGADRVGLLTGDHSINPAAAVVVMTTEVLRNMIYGDAALDDLGLVVIDEVHFLQDAYRGPVWEEVIIQLPEPVRLVCLSATVSNSAELAGWIETVRGPCQPVVETHRPVPLDQRYLVDDLNTDRTRVFETLVDGAANPAAEQFLLRGARSSGPRRSGPRRGRSTLATPDRFEVLHHLRSQHLLPAVHFVFSRRQCAEAAQACVSAGVRLSEDWERDRLVALAEERVEQLAPADLDAVGYGEFIGQLSVGVAQHHAGLIPAFKEVVELGFIAGYIKLVYATETLAVGVNMPARSVVIDKLTKYNGEHHEMLSAAQFTQLSGRAGRRGMDTRGTVLVLYSPFVGFDTVAELASADGFALRSAFRPTYNMAANLVARYDESRARQFLGLSFAQYQADRHVVGLERQIGRLERRLAEELALANSGEGDIAAYRATLDRRRSTAIHDAGDDAHGDNGDSANGDSGVENAIEDALRSLRPGDVVAIDKGTFKGPAAVVATSVRSAGTKVTLITPAANIVKLAADDWPDPPTVITRVVLPGSFSPHQRDYRAEVGQRVRAATLGKAGADRRTTETRRAPTERPKIAADPRLAERVLAYEASERTRRELEAKRRRVARRDGALAAEFDRVLDVLEGFGFVERARWRLTDLGEMLTKIFHENDLLICRALEAGLFDDLDEASLAGLASTFIYEHRSPDEPPPPWFPSPLVAERWEQIVDLSDDQARRERQANRNQHRRPAPTLFAAVHGWVAGGGLELVLDEDMTGGDFVRSIRQLSDLLEQIGHAAPSPSTRAVARRAAVAAYRGVVADTASEELVAKR